jgi:hypothetical protein
MGDGANGKAGAAKMSDERMQIVEPLVVIGRSEDGEVGVAFLNGMTPGGAVLLMLQQVQFLLGGFSFRRQSKIVGVTGVLPPDLDVNAGRR